MRHLPVVLALALAACSSNSAAPEAAEGGEAIGCAVNGATSFARVCAVDRAKRDGVLTLVVRHPDGSFRRFDVLDNGLGLAVADGAQQAVTRYADGFAEIAVGSDRYRFPITVRNDAAKK